MPNYGYRCTVCSHEFERVQKITDPRLTECEECNDSKEEAPGRSKPDTKPTTT